MSADPRSPCIELGRIEQIRPACPFPREMDGILNFVPCGQEPSAPLWLRVKTAVGGKKVQCHLELAVLGSRAALLSSQGSCWKAQVERGLERGVPSLPTGKAVLRGECPVGRMEASAPRELPSCWLRSPCRQERVGRMRRSRQEDRKQGRGREGGEGEGEQASPGSAEQASSASWVGRALGFAHTCPHVSALSCGNELVVFFQKSPVSLNCHVLLAGPAFHGPPRSKQGTGGEHTPQAQPVRAHTHPRPPRKGQSLPGQFGAPRWKKVTRGCQAAISLVENPPRVEEEAIRFESPWEPGALGSSYWIYSPRPFW